MNRRAFLVASAVLPIVAACAPSVDTEQTTTATAVVETVDPVSRELLLRGDSGSQSGQLLSMIVSPRVQRLNEIHPGDHVTVTVGSLHGGTRGNVIAERASLEVSVRGGTIA